MATPSDESTNRVLLDPKGPLTKVLSPSDIKMVNDEVTKVYEKMDSSAVESISDKRGRSKKGDPSKMQLRFNQIDL